jgi:hypothetical protein
MEFSELWSTSGIYLCGQLFGTQISARLETISNRMDYICNMAKGNMDAIVGTIDLMICGENIVVWIGSAV